MLPIPAPVLRLLFPLRRAYWHLRRPRTFGVKALLAHPDGGGRLLVVRHSYGDRARWGLPGGGYRPARETAAEAVAREVREELGLVIAPGAFAELDTVLVDGGGKRDTLTLFAARAVDAGVRRSPELAEARWVADVGELGAARVSRWLRLALERRG
ncbi:NUDIX hydrolase [Actinorhabdospora filicis]|uniref:NUDIX hydrolase n=1 Tax=Actinorhabdospora filicis TaxID=1785913 RepID=A0A9W6W4G5_9ACTN|nr:NUDIX hydrolase [Actinorhabdospora filicis]GLZ79237.1 NUDIX hydrolase [Actinorhabdospora filicis]